MKSIFTYLNEVVTCERVSIFFVHVILNDVFIDTKVFHQTFSFGEGIKNKIYIFGPFSTKSLVNSRLKARYTLKKNALMLDT